MGIYKRKESERTDMYIYKITNNLNGKFYIGQTVRTPEVRWERHKSDALGDRHLDTHFARAIRKYGPENFTVETIDTASSQEELTKKEHDWIVKTRAAEEGYNETSAIEKCGGNTYESKTEEELKCIAEKIRKTKLGGNNPNSTKVKCKDVTTGEEFHFDSQTEMQKFFNAPNHLFISRRCLGQIKSLYKKRWLISYEDGEIVAKDPVGKGSDKAVSVHVEDLQTGENKSFSSYSDAERYFGQKRRAFSSKAYKRGNSFVCKSRYKITKILE